MKPPPATVESDSPQVHHEGIPAIASTTNWATPNAIVPSAK